MTLSSPIEDDQSMPIIESNKLIRIGVGPQLTAYIKDAYHRRHFSIMESRARAFGSAKDTMLGQIWLILEPFLSSAMYFIIFGFMLGFSRGSENFVAYLVIGLISFNILQKGLTASSAIEGNGKRLVQSFSFPKIALIFSYTLRIYIDFIPTGIAMLIFIIAMPPHAYPTMTWLIVPIIYLAAAPFIFGLAALTSTFVVLIPDLRLLINLFGRFWFYGSGIMWTINMLDGKPIIQDLMRLNPGWVYLEMLRTSLLSNQMPSVEQWLYLLVWSFGIGMIGFLVMWRSDIAIGKALLR